MADIKISGRKVSVSDSMREHVNSKVGEALKVFDIKPMSCDVVLRVDKNPSNPDRKMCEVTVFVRDYVVRVEASSSDMYAAIDEAAEKVTRQLRKYKTRVVDRKVRATEKVATGAPDASGDVDFDALMDELSADDAILRVKEIDFEPLTEEEALVKIDLLDHDFFVYTDRDSGQVNIIYRRKNGGYGKLMPKE